LTPACNHRSNCRLCGSASLTKVFSLTPTPPANAFVSKENLNTPQPTSPLKLYFCETCFHLQLLDFIDPNDLFRSYIYVSSTSPNFVKHFKDYANTLIRRLRLKAGDTTIDIGSNDGVFLKFFQKKKLNVLGIDPAQSIANKANNNGIETWPEFFDQNCADRIIKQKGLVSLVTANNVFAHIDDLSEIATSIRSLLKPDGVFVFEVSYLVDIYEKTLFDTIYHEHLSYHSVQPLAMFFKSKNMELFSAERIPTHGGSLRGMVQIAGGPHKSDGSVESLITHEKKLSLDKLKTWDRFSEKINNRRNILVDLLSRLKKEGKTIAGYGAPAKATTLMYHFNIGPDIIDFIVDDAPLKQGLYSPGLHIPILSSPALYIKKPDYVVLLAWNYAQQIKDDHQNYLNDGGHFIQPLPDVKVY